MNFTLAESDQGGCESGARLAVTCQGTFASGPLAFNCHPKPSMDAGAAAVIALGGRGMLGLATSKPSAGRESAMTRLALF